MKRPTAPERPATHGAPARGGKETLHRLRLRGGSLDAIAEASGVSKVTIYSYFPTKADLFEASITHRIEAQFSTMEWSRLDPRKPADALAKIGRAFLALMRSPDVVNQHRALYGALGKDAGPAASFFEAGPLAIVGAVSDYLRAAHRAGRLKVSDPALAGNQYLSLYLGLGHIRTLLGLTPPTKAQDEALVKSNVALFLRAFER